MKDKLYTAWRAFRRGKRPSPAIDEFAYALEQNLDELAEEIETGNYRHGGYRRVVVQEKKRRDLAVANVRDRVAHRLVYDELVDIYDKQFDPDVWSCRKGKGLHACLRRTQALMVKHRNTYIWRMDIEKFFDHVDHATLKSLLKGRSLYEGLCSEVINSYSCQDGGGQCLTEKKRGIPIGNLTSQVFANIYLNEFDRFVRHELKPLAYARYGDDAILFLTTRKNARESRQAATKFLKNHLKLTVNPKNDVIIAANQPLHFLGHVITQNYIVTDRHTTEAAIAKTNLKNVASYKSLKLAKWPKRQLDYQILNEIEKVLHS